MKGIDSSILVYAIDPTTVEHRRARDAIPSLEGWAINPTVVHEVFHTLAFKRMFSPKDAKSKLGVLVKDKRTSFLNITKTVSLCSLDLASEFEMGGRDSLTVGSYMHNGVKGMLTHDRDLLSLKKMKFRGKQITFIDPLAA